MVNCIIKSSLSRICEQYLFSLPVIFSFTGHKWDGAHREAGLAKCHDLCHSHIQVLWDLTAPSQPPCSCSTIRAMPALLSSQQSPNPTGNCYTSQTPSPSPQQHCVTLHVGHHYSATLKADQNLTGLTHSYSILPVQLRRGFVYSCSSRACLYVHCWTDEPWDVSLMWTKYELTSDEIW